MISEARRLPASMLVIGALMLGGFLVVCAATIVAVVGDDRPRMPDLFQLTLPAGVDIVDSHSTCDASECDGYGLVVERDGTAPEAVIDLLELALVDQGWAGRACPPGEVCLGRDGLGIVLVPWSAVDETTAASMRGALRDRGVDQAALVYMLYHRCGSLHPCP